MTIAPWQPETLTAGETTAIAPWQPEEVARTTVKMPSFGQAAAAPPLALTGKRVNIVSPNGEAFSVDESELPKVQAQGFAVETPEARAVREYVQENKGLSGTAKVAFRSFLNEATFGVSDPILDHVDDPLDRKKAEALKRDHAVANVLGGVGGFATSLLYGGEFFKGAELAGRAAEAAVLGGERLAAVGAERVASSAAYRVADKTAAAMVSERLIAAGVPAAEAAAAGPGIARKLIASGAKFGAEGGVFAAPRAVTEAALGDPDRAAETLLAGVGGGALLGAFAPGAAAITKATVAGLGKAKLPGTVRELAGSLAEGQAWRSLNPIKADARRAAKLPGGTDGVGRMLLDEGLVRGLDGDIADQGAAIAARKAEVGERIGGRYAKLDEAGLESGVKVNDLVKRLDKEVLKPLEGMPGMEQVAGKVRSYIDAFTEKGATGGYGFASKAAKENVSFSRLFEVRQALDDLVYRSEAATPTLKDAEMRKIRGIFQEELEQRGERVARSLGDDHFLTGLKDDNLLYRRLIVAQKAAGQAVEAQTANRAVGLTDHLVGLGSVVMGGGNPLLGVAGAIGNKALREKGNAFAANTLERFARGGGTAGLLEANHAAALQLDRVPSILDRLAAGERSPARATLPAHGLAALLNIGSSTDTDTNPVEHYRALGEKLSELSANPDRMQAQLAKLVAPYSSDAPETTAALALKAPAVVQHLLATMPRTPSLPDPLTGRTQRPSSAAISEWGRRAQVAQTPWTVLDRLADRSLTRADVDTLRALYPKLHDEVIGRVQRWAASDAAKQIPAADRQRLSLVLGVPLDPVNVASFQSAYDQSAAKKKHGGGGAAKGPDLSTATQALTFK